MTETNGNSPFTHTDKKPGDIIRSEDWNNAMNEVLRLDTDKVNRKGTDKIQGPLTIEAALTINDKVGIGTAPGTEQLKVQGAVTIAGNLSVTGDNKLGIGTTTPTEKLEIQITGGDDQKTNFLSLFNNGTGATQESRIVWKNGPADNSKLAAAIASRPGGSYNAGDLRFQTAISGSLENRMIITSDGNVGIGTATPTDKLSVNGNTQIAGFLSTTGTDGNLTVAGTSTLNGNTAIAGSLSIGVQDYTIEVTGSSNAASANNKTSLKVKNISIHQLANGDGINTVILKPDGSVRTGELSHNVWSSQTLWETWANLVGNASDGDVVVVASSGGVKPVLQTSSRAKELLAFIGASNPLGNEFIGSVSYALAFVKGKKDSARELFKAFDKGDAVLTTSYWALSSALDVIGNAAIAGKITATAFEGVGAIVKGMIVMWGGNANNVPTGWALCNGDSGTPNLSGKFILGNSASYTVGTTGGNIGVTLATSNIPSHTHEITVNSAGEHSHKYEKPLFTPQGVSGSTQRPQFFSDWTTPPPDTHTAGTHTHTASATTVGSTSPTAIDIMPPFYVLAYIQYVGV
ncbi:phage tail protein [Nodosilinea sp. FACHB-13]|uniref:phage tail protein n=1 Tax=Cyanophyceae TaxID=3028117 RepID=UPI00168796DE|nr:phage tail protein [Nodosilinea sp. FACHB-13]MBD2110042.1 tail fiber protein [Nodosilinea sp. FACHB-13]